MRPPALALTAAAALIALVGCTTPSEPSAAPTTEVGSPAPTPTTAGVDPGDTATWVITADGVGPVPLGTPLDEVASLVPSATVVDCPSVWLELPDFPILIASGETDAAVLTVGDPELFGRSWGLAGSPSTAEGIGIGSTADEVEAAYPDAEPQTSSTERTYYSIPAGGGHLVISMNATGAVEMISVGGTDQPLPEFCG